MQSLLRRLLFVSLLLVSGLMSPLRAQGDVLYGVSFSQSEIFIIDLGTGAATLVGSTTLNGVGGIAFDDTGTLYGITDHTFPPPGTTDLYTLDPWAGTATLVGTASFGGGEGALVYDPGAGLFYTKTNLSGGTTQQLMTLDPNTGAGTVIGSMGFTTVQADVSGMALLANGTLVAFDPQSNLVDRLHSIDKVTGAASVIGPTGTTLTSTGGLAVDPSTGTLYLSDATSLFEVDPVTGAATLIGTHGAWITGLSFGPGPGSTCLIGLETSSTLYDVSHIDGTGSFPRSTIDSLGGLALSPGGTLYALRYAAPSGELYTLNPLNGAATLVGPVGIPTREGGLDFDPVSGDLYGGNGLNGGALYTLDTGTGAATVVGIVLDEFGQPIDLSALAFDAVGNLYGLKRTTAPEIYHIDPVNGDVFDRVPIPNFPAGEELGGMEFDDTTGILYAVIGDKLVTLNPTTGATSVLGTTPIRSALEVAATCPPPTCVVPQTADTDILISIIGTVGGGGHLRLRDACGELDPTRIGKGEVTLSNAPGHAPALFLGAFPPVDPVEYSWGTTVAQPTMAMPYVTDVFGEVRFELPANLGPATVLAQWAVLDPQASAGIALSNALRIEWR